MAAKKIFRKAVVSDAKKISALKTRQLTVFTDVPEDRALIRSVKLENVLYPALVGIVDLPSPSWRRVGVVVQN